MPASRHDGDTVGDVDFWSSFPRNGMQWSRALREPALEVSAVCQVYGTSCEGELPLPNITHHLKWPLFVAMSSLLILVLDLECLMFLAETLAVDAHGHRSTAGSRDLRAVVMQCAWGFCANFAICVGGLV